jgi:hypothetical protein
MGTQLVKETEIGGNCWANIRALLVTLGRAYSRQCLYSGAPLDEAFPDIGCHVPDGRAWILESFEQFSVRDALGLVFLVSSNKDVRSAGVTVIASLIEMVYTSDAFD